MSALSAGLLGLIVATREQIKMLATSPRQTLRLVGTVVGLVLSVGSAAVATDTPTDRFLGLAAIIQIWSVTAGAWTVATPFLIDLFSWLAEQTSDFAVLTILLAALALCGVGALTYAAFVLIWWAPVAILASAVSLAALEMRFGSPTDRLLSWIAARGASSEARPSL